MSKLLVIWHNRCDDGFGAAWAVRHAHPDAEFVAGVYGRKLDVNRFAGRDVVFVDFCYEPAVMEEIAGVVASILVLDHHKSSLRAMQEHFGWDDPLVERMSHSQGIIGARFGEKGAAIFDMDRSGAMMAWDHFHPGVPAPAFIAYIQDRDLWKKELPGVDEFTAGLRSYPMDFKTWDGLFMPGFTKQDDLAPWPNGITPLGDKATEDDYKIRAQMIHLYHQECVFALIKEGKPVERYKNQLVEAAARNSFWVNIEIPGELQRNINAPDLFVRGMSKTVRIRGANVMPAISSEVGEVLAQRFGGKSLTWVEGPSLWTYSLRSRAVNGQPAADVADIATRFGGGGHAQAAGFKAKTAVHTKIEDEEKESGD